MLLNAYAYDMPLKFSTLSLPKGTLLAVVSEGRALVS
jgi:hypothetical protein